MKSALFTRPGLRIERITPHEGPTPVFNAWKPNRSQCFTDTKKLLKFAAWPKSTPTGQELREWVSSFEIDPPTKAEQTEVEPNENTKVII